jgi:SprT protein
MAMKSVKSKDDIKEVLKKYLPEEFVETIAAFLFTNTVRFKIVRGRTSKLGDFKAGLNGTIHQITVNGDLNPYSFLITTLHEFAHLITYDTYKAHVLPHGEEWKLCFRNLLMPIIKSGHLPKDIEHALIHSTNNIKASSCSDQGLMRVLKTYDRPKEGVVLLEKLAENAKFELQGRLFVKGVLRRKRFICHDTYSDKSYLINALAEVREING